MWIGLVIMFFVWEFGKALIFHHFWGDSHEEDDKDDSSGK